MSNHPTVLAAILLSEILLAENTALASMDIPSANRMLAAKQAAMDNLLLAHRQHGLPAPADGQDVMQRLRDLAAHNKTLLERAMVAQNRIMACIARAVPKALGQGGRYGATGGPTTSRSMVPVALSARA